eukprot:GILK01002888.1.p1 GENE.GILK01002888.1~~GILK01002888.1.p1  ORF type:complete len:501 (-),score=80.08 GILK01002888.1:109-1611(-)
MVDAFLVAITTIIAVVLVLINFYILVYFQHEEDKGMNGSIFCKILVVFGLTLAWGMVLCLPLDVANSRSGGGGLDIKDLWYAFYITTAIMVVVLIPFAIFYYEGDEEESMGERIVGAIKYEILVFAICSALFAIMYSLLNEASIPIRTYQCGWDTAIQNYADSSRSSPSMNGGCTTTADTLNLTVTFAIYLMAMLSFVGWFLFVAFGGVGLSALPIDLISDWKNRPKSVNLQYFAEKKKEIGMRAQTLIEAGSFLEQEKRELNLVKGWEKRRKINKYRTNYNKFQQMVYMLDKEWKVLNLAFGGAGGNPIIPWLKLVCGAFAAVLSVCWIIHILLYQLLQRNRAPISTFFNVFLQDLDLNGFSLFSVIGFGVIVLYLLWATMKGNMKFGMRFFFCCPIHPMEKGETLMNSFLFNVMLLLISSVAITQFAANALAEYARFTDADMIFGVQVKYLTFFKIFWAENIFLYMFLVWALLTALYLAIKPADKPAIDLNAVRRPRV